MTNQTDTLLSSILTAVTGMAKTLHKVREEQKLSAERLETLETETEQLSKDIATLTDAQNKKLETISSKIETTHQDLTISTQQNADNIKHTVDTQLTGLINVITDDTTSEDTYNLLKDVNDILKTEVITSRDTILTKLDNMNQLELLRTLIEALSMMQQDMTTLTNAIKDNNQAFTDIREANSLMSARLNSVDLRLASFSGKETDTDDDVDALTDIVRLLEEQQ